VLLRSIGGGKKLHTAHKHEAPLTAGTHVAAADAHDGR